MPERRPDPATDPSETRPEAPPPHLLTTPVWPRSGVAAGSGDARPAIALPDHPYWRGPAVAVGGVLFSASPPPPDIIDAHEALHGVDANIDAPTCMWLVHSPMWETPRTADLSVASGTQQVWATVLGGELWRSDGVTAKAALLSECEWAKDAVWTPLSAAGLPVWWAPTTPGTVESVAAELAAVKAELARREAVDQRVGSTADLLAKVDAFRAEHARTTGQKYSHEEAVRVLLLVGLEAKLKDRRCPKCGGPFPEGKRVDAKWCSQDCASAASAIRRYHERKAEKISVAD